MTGSIRTPAVCGYVRVCKHSGSVDIGGDFENELEGLVFLYLGRAIPHKN